MSFRHGDILYGMGLCFMKKNDYSQALEKLLKAEELFEKYLPVNDKFVEKFYRLFNSIALVYFLLEDDLNALLMLKKSVDIYSTVNSN